MRLWLKFVLALVVLMLLSVALLFTPLFNITEITVSGASGTVLKISSVCREFFQVIMLY
jgi:cell division septal protein FtsQ